jgi:mRNA-degrading endonuclease toxin of MazEF toxin-antitoxin module
MPSTTSFSQGDVVLVPFPFTDLSAVKQRPALVLSPDRLNKARVDIVVAAITSQIRMSLAKMTFCCRLPISCWFAQSVDNQTW